MTYIPDPPDPKDPQVHHTVGYRSSDARPVTAPVPPKPPRKQRVVGRVRNVEVLEGLYTFTMLAPKGDKQGGVYVRKRNHRKVTFLPFSQLAAGAALTVRVGQDGNLIKLVLRPEGLEVTRSDKAVVMLDYSTIANLTQTQPSLFPDE